MERKKILAVIIGGLLALVVIVSPYLEAGNGNELYITSDKQQQSEQGTVLSNEQLIKLFNVSSNYQDLLNGSITVEHDINFQVPGKYNIKFIANYQEVLCFDDKNDADGNGTGKNTQGNVVGTYCQNNADDGEVGDNDRYKFIDKQKVQTASLTITKKALSIIADGYKADYEHVTYTNEQLIKLFNVTTVGNQNNLPITVTHNIDFDKPGLYDVTFTVDGVKKVANYEVLDIKPTLTTSNEFTIKINENVNYMEAYNISASEFAENDLNQYVKIHDKDVDYSKPGDYQVAISVSDQEGNVVIAKVTLHITKETEKAVLNSKEKVIARVGTELTNDQLIELFELTGNYNLDLNNITVEQSIDYSKPGEYNITFIDKTNNTQSSSVLKLVYVEKKLEIAKICSPINKIMTKQDYIDAYTTQVGEIKDQSIIDTLIIDDSKVDYNKVGTYQVNVLATNNLGEQLNRTFALCLYEEEEDNSEVDSEENNSEVDNEEDNSEVDNEEDNSEVDNEEDNSEVDNEEDNSEVDNEEDNSEVDNEEDNSEVDSEEDNSEVDSEEDNSEVDSEEDNSEVDSEEDNSEVDSEEDNSEVDSEEDNSEVDNEDTCKEQMTLSKVLSYNVPNLFIGLADSILNTLNIDTSDIDYESLGIYPLSDLSLSNSSDCVDNEENNSEVDSEENNSEVDSEEDNSEVNSEENNSEVDSEEDNSEVNSEENNSEVDSEEDNSEEDNSEVDNEDTCKEQMTLSKVLSYNVPNLFIGLADSILNTLNIDTSDIDYESLGIYPLSDLSLNNSSDCVDNEENNSEVDSEENNSEVDSEENNGEVDSEENNSEVDSEENNSEVDSEENNSEVDSEEENSEVDSEENNSEVDNEENNSEVDSEEDNSEVNSEENNSEVDSEEDNSEVNSEEYNSEVDSEEDNSEVNSEEDNSEVNSEEDNSEVDNEDTCKEQMTLSKVLSYNVPNLFIGLADSILNTLNIDTSDIDYESLGIYPLSDLSLSNSSDCVDNEENNSEVNSEEDNSEVDSEENNSEVDSEENNSEVDNEENNSEVDSEENNSEVDNEENNSEVDNEENNSEVDSEENNSEVDNEDTCTQQSKLTKTSPVVSYKVSEVTIGLADALTDNDLRNLFEQPDSVTVIHNIIPNKVGTYQVRFEGGGCSTTATLNVQKEIVIKNIKQVEKFLKDNDLNNVEVSEIKEGKYNVATINPETGNEEHVIVSYKLEDTGSGVILVIAGLIVGLGIIIYIKVRVK